MSIEKITERIMADAQSNADEIMNKAKERAGHIKADAQEKADKILRDADKNGKIEKEKIISQKHAVADIDGRKFILQRKQDMIEECFNEAVKKISTMDEDKYINFLTTVVKDSGIKKGTIILNKKDKDAIGQKLIQHLEEAIQGSEYKLSEENGKFTGGLIIRSGKVYVNGTVDSFVAEAKEEMANSVAEVLFR